MTTTGISTERLDALLGRVVTEPSVHARFTNTLSLLEYIGARKILKSQDAATFSAELLAHVSEEIRHALVMKKLALKLDASVDSYRPEHLLCGTEAGQYMQSIDRGAEASLRERPAAAAGPTWVNYLYTTLLVEERANLLYPLYAERLRPLGHAALVNSIVREEESHLRDVWKGLTVGDPSHESRLADLRPLEAASFERWMTAIEKAI